MALRIANNLAAMNTQRWLGVSDAGMRKSLERLSSGYRINKAADDAAGLAISQAFRANIASSKVASRNTSEAAALLQVAEGGMDQIGNMLTRLKELATQGASANAGSSERAKIDAEGTALLNEIDRIANSSKYGSTELLNGTFGAAMDAGTFQYSGNQAIGKGTYSMTHNYVAAGTAETADAFSGSFITSLGSTMAYSGTWTLSVTGTTITMGNTTITESAAITTFTTAAAGNQTVTFANLAITMDVSTVSGVAASTTMSVDTTIDIQETGLTSLNVASADAGTYEFVKGTAADKIALGNGTITQTLDVVIGDVQTLDFTSLGVSFTLGATYSEDDLESMNFEVTASGSGGNTFQIGSENDSDHQISIEIDGTTKSDLGLTDLDFAEAANAQAALALIDTAIGSLASSRGDIGAYMNRLAYASANLATTIENTQAAESVIRDVDMASEMTMFTKNQILLQAGTAMLAQANMAPQQVLALFG